MKLQGLLQSLEQSFETLNELIENAPPGEARRSMMKAQGYLSETIRQMEEVLKEEPPEEEIVEKKKFSRWA